MEEAAGWIPTRSTKFLNNLDNANAYNHDIYVLVCVITRGFGARGDCFHRTAPRFRADLPVQLSIPLLT